MKKILVKGNRIKFGPVELRRVKVLDPEARPKTVTVLIPKKEEGLITTIYQLSEEARIKSGLSSDMWIGPLNDGDVEEHRWQDDFAGYYYFAPTAFDKTRFVFDAEGNPITDKDGLRDGDFAYLTLEMLASKKENNKKGKAVAYSRIIRIDKAKREEAQQEIASVVVRKVDSQVELITPEVAKYYLSLNRSNREANKRTVNYYCNLMLSGLWRENQGEPINFSDEGFLIDGQHRLMAVIQAEMPIRMTVVRGSSGEDFKVLNQGKTRNLRDVLFIGDVPNAKDVSAVMTKYQALLNGQQYTFATGKGREKVRHQAPSFSLDDYWNAKELFDEAVRISRVGRGKKILYPSQIGGMVVYITRHTFYPFGLAEKFFRELHTASESHPTCNALRSLFISDNNSKVKKLTPQKRNALLIKAWNIYAKGGRASRLPYQGEEKVSFENLRPEGDVNNKVFPF